MADQEGAATRASAIPGPAVTSYPVLEAVGSEIERAGDVWRVGGRALDFGLLHDLVRRGDPTAFEGSDLAARAVSPGETLAQPSEADGAGGSPAGTDGPRVPRLPEPSEPGAGVSVRDDGAFRSTGYGYLCILRNVLSVVSPVLVSGDGMKAWYIDIPQVGDPRYPDVGELERLLEARGIRGIDRDRLGAFCAGLPAAGRRPVAATLVEGRAPVPGRDARLVFEMDPETPPGAAREDGSTGARERPLFSRVKAGDRLGRKSPAVPGIPGMTLYGQRLETTDGVDVPAEPGQGVRVEPDGADLVFYASRDGVVSRMGDCVQVSSMLHLEGDVDAATGHVDTDQDVYVAGSVRSGFRVDAGGHVTVAGGVESGAVIRAKGNLSVSGGIVGRNTLVVVLGDLRAHFIQNGRAVVRGDVWIGSYLHYASVQCGGVLTVNPGTGNRGGSVIGGTLSATRGIQVVQAGSPLAVKTVLALRTNPETRARMARLADALKADEDTIAKMMRTLGVRQLNAASVRLAMERAAAPQRQLLVKVLEQLGILIKRRDESLRERRRLEAGEREKIEGGSIRISSFVHDNVEIQIEPERIAAPEGRGPVAFRWSGNGILADRAAG